MENVLVVGGGGREHALVWKLSQSDRVKQIFAIPGSCAIETIEKASSVSNIEVKNFQVRFLSIVLLYEVMLFSFCF